MVTIRDYLKRANPVLTINTKTTQSTDQVDWEPVEAFETYDEFNHELLVTLYGDVIDYEFDAKELPTPSKLLPIERSIRSERELEQDPLKRNIIARVNYALVAAYKYMNKKDPGNAFPYPPAMVCGTKLPRGGAVPDWIQYQEGFNEPLACGETKLSTVFEMERTINSTDKRFDTPIEQCLHYCIINKTRHGFMITDKELVVLRIRQEEPQEGIASQRPRRNVQPAHYSFGSSSLASTQAMSLSTNPESEGEKFVEYRIIDWSATTDLTVCLALFLLALIASAPTGKTDICDTYDPLDKWEWNGSIYQNNTSGRTRKSLKKGHSELVAWSTYKDGDNRTYYSSYKGQTYWQELWDNQYERMYYQDHPNTKSWEKPKSISSNHLSYYLLTSTGLVRTYDDCVQI
jgi:hypothetical protein